MPKSLGDFSNLKFLNILCFGKSTSVYNFSKTATVNCNPLLCSRSLSRFKHPSHPPVPSSYGTQSWNANLNIFRSLNAISSLRLGGPQKFSQSGCDGLLQSGMD
eukprot:03722.XXX_46055_46366_1 [CDS] Oithona nana genome sequencing.